MSRVNCNERKKQQQTRNAHIELRTPKPHDRCTCSIVAVDGGYGQKKRNTKMKQAKK